MKQYRATRLPILVLFLMIISLVASANGKTNSDTQIYLPAIYASPGNWIAANQWGINDRGGKTIGMLETGQNQFKLIGDQYVINLNGNGTADYAAYDTTMREISIPMPGGHYLVGGSNSYDDCKTIIGMYDQNDVNLWQRGVTLPDATCYDTLSLVTGDESIYIGQPFNQRFLGHDSWLARLDKDGNLAWSKLIGQGWVSGPFAMAGTTDDNLVFTAMRSGNAYSMLLAELNSSGQLIRAKEFVSAGVAISYSPWAISGTPDHGYILAGASNEYVVWALKLDKNWNISWQNNFISSNLTQVRSAIGLHDGGALLSGVLENGRNYILKIQPDGSPAWLRTYNMITDINAIQEAGDGDLLVAGTTQSLGEGEKPLSMKLNPDGLVDNCDLINSVMVEPSLLNLAMSSTTTTMQDVFAEVQTVDPGYTGLVDVQSIGICGDETMVANCR